MSDFASQQPPPVEGGQPDLDSEEKIPKPKASPQMPTADSQDNLKSPVSTDMDGDTAVGIAAKDSESELPVVGGDADVNTGAHGAGAAVSDPETVAVSDHHSKGLGGTVQPALVSKLESSTAARDDRDTNPTADAGQPVVVATKPSKSPQHGDGDGQRNIVVEKIADVPNTKEGAVTRLTDAAEPNSGEAHSEPVNVTVAQAVTEKPKYNVEALHFAAEKNDAETVKACLEAGIDFDARDGNRWTALHFAALRGSLDVIDVLVEAGADRLLRTEDGWTPLHCACFCNNTDAAQRLLEAREQMQRALLWPDEQGLNALDLLHNERKKQDLIDWVGLDAADRQARMHTAKVNLALRTEQQRQTRLNQQLSTSQQSHHGGRSGHRSGGDDGSNLQGDGGMGPVAQKGLHEARRSELRTRPLRQGWPSWVKSVPLDKKDLKRSGDVAQPDYGAGGCPPPIPKGTLVLDDDDDDDGADGGAMQMRLDESASGIGNGFMGQLEASESERLPTLTSHGGGGGVPTKHRQSKASARPLAKLQRSRDSSMQTGPVDNVYRAGYGTVSGGNTQCGTSSLLSDNQSGRGGGGSLKLPPLGGSMGRDTPDRDRVYIPLDQTTTDSGMMHRHGDSDVFEDNHYMNDSLHIEDLQGSTKSRHGHGHGGKHETDSSTQTHDSSERTRSHPVDTCTTTDTLSRQPPAPLSQGERAMYEAELLELRRVALFHEQLGQRLQISLSEEKARAKAARAEAEKKLWKAFNEVKRDRAEVVVARRNAEVQREMITGLDDETNMLRVKVATLENEIKKIRQENADNDRMVRNHQIVAERAKVWAKEYADGVDDVKKEAGLLHELIVTANQSLKSCMGYFRKVEIRDSPQATDTKVLAQVAGSDMIELVKSPFGHRDVKETKMTISLWCKAKVEGLRHPDRPMLIRVLKPWARGDVGTPHSRMEDWMSTYDCMVLASGVPNVARVHTTFWDEVPWSWMPVELTIACRGNPTRVERTGFALMETYHEDLKTSLHRRGVFSETETMMLLAEVLTALNGLEEVGLYHRALRLDAILLSRQGTAHLGGFHDAARACDMEVVEGRHEGPRPMDSLRFADRRIVAPELRYLRDKQVLDWHKADVFTLGCLAYRVLGRPHAFCADPQVPVEVIALRLARFNATPIHVNVSDSFLAVLRSLLAVNADLRPGPSEALMLVSTLLWNQWFSEASAGLTNVLSLQGEQECEVWLLSLRSLVHSELACTHSASVVIPSETSSKGDSIEFAITEGGSGERRRDIFSLITKFLESTTAAKLWHSVRTIIQLVQKLKQDQSDPDYWKSEDALETS